MTPEQYWTQLGQRSAVTRELLSVAYARYAALGLANWLPINERAATRDDWTSPDAAGPTGL